jgi:predicted Zn-dependent peptidase
MRRLTAITILGLLFSTSSAAQSLQATSKLQLPPYSRVQLGNGFTIMLMEQHEVPIVSFSLIIKAGSTADPSGKEGLAALTAEMLRKGGTRSRTADEIANELDFIGGEFDMAAAVDFTGGTAEFLRKDLQHGIDIVSDILLNPTFPQDEADKLIKQRVDGIKSAKDRADSVIARYFNMYLYGKHPYGRSVGGDENSLSQITRSDIQDFYQTWYTPGNIILAVAGDFQTADMRAQLEERFAGWPRKLVTRVSLEEPLPALHKRLLLVDKPDSTQTYFYIGNVGVSRTNPDRVGIGILNTLFGGRFTSRLNTALRTDSGLTYGARSAFDQRQWAGPFLISTYTRNATTEQAIDMTLELLRDFHQNGITEDELRSARNYVKGQFPTSIETSSQLASAISRLEFYGLDERDINDYYDKVDSLTVPEAHRLIKQYFPLENLTFVLIGKGSEIETIAEKYAPQIDRKSISDPGF